MKTGKQILDIVTSGMYNDAMMVIREYVQNAVDSIDEAVDRGLIRDQQARIDITLNADDRSISISDDGAGIADEQVSSLLCGIALSSKSLGNRRGFRGIGRLGGLGYCDQVIFETRSNESPSVFVASWNATTLRNACRSNDSEIDAGNVLKRVVTSEKRSARRDERPHFFRVTMQGVHRFHEDHLMHLDYVKRYLGRVAPVPFDAEQFPFAEEIYSRLNAVVGFKTYNIFINGEQIYRPHTVQFGLGHNSADRIQELEFFDVTSRTGSKIGAGWFAKTHYLASIPPAVEMRGIRVRQGNIEIGDELFLADCFSERRFATWHVGEIHVDYSLRANARRDGFEETPDYEALLEQSRWLCRHLSNLCRSSSKARSRNMMCVRDLGRLESIIEQSFYIDEAHWEQTLDSAVKLLEQIKKAKIVDSDVRGIEDRILIAEDRLAKLSKQNPTLLTVLDGRTLRHYDHKELVTDIAKRIFDHHDGNITAEELVRIVLEPYIRPSVRS